MKKYILLPLFPILFVSLLSSEEYVASDDLDGYYDVSPVLSIRHDDLDGGIDVSDAIGLEMNLGGNKFTGFDTDGTDYRIYIGWGFGKIGFGDDGSGTGEYTVGATYEILDKISMDLDYVFNENSENLRLAIQIHF